DRIAVVPIWIHCVAPIGISLPDRVGQELVLTCLWPRFHTLRMSLVKTQNFLQKHNIGAGGANGVTQFMQHETPVEVRKTFVCVYRKDFKSQIRSVIVHEHPWQ